MLMSAQAGPDVGGVMGAGDHLQVRRSRYYWHHGIDCGDGTVIHCTGDRRTGRRVTRSTLGEFAQDGTIVIREYRRRLPSAETVARAEARLGESRYHLVRHNCEHFATWCCTGRAVSGQVRHASAWTVQGSLVAASVTVTGASEVTLAGLAGIVLAALRRWRRRAAGVLHHPDQAPPSSSGLPEVLTAGAAHR